MAMSAIEMFTKRLQTRGFLMVGLAVAGCGVPLPGESGTSSDGDPLKLAPAVNCPAAPDGIDPRAAQAYDRVNAYRHAAGLGCSAYSPQIAAAAADHSAYYAANTGACVASPHVEVMGCQKFTGAHFADRMRAAGYNGVGAYEAMTYVGDGSKAVDLWVDSVWHRIPILSPFVGDSGYGGAPMVDTMDFAWAPTAYTGAPVVYPFAGETDVPRSFDGSTESPQLPVPPQGWPSGYPIIVYGVDLKITSHTLDHTFISPGDPASMGILENESVLYAHQPLESNSTYRVVVVGKHDDDAVHLDWSFTTR